MTIIKSQPFGIQRKIVANMTADSNKNIPHVTYMYEADVRILNCEYQRKKPNLFLSELLQFVRTVQKTTRMVVNIKF